MNATELHDRSVGDLTKQLSQDVSDLVRKELELGKAELSAKLRTLAVGGGLIAGGAVLLLATLGALTAAAILALSNVLDAWLAALVVGAAIGLVATLLVLIGLKSIRRAAPAVPTETVESVKEDVAWVKTRAKSALR
jgi:putative superfamily III holin-X